MDYADEQQSEIEALESIYPSEFVLLSSAPFSLTILVKSESYDSGDGLIANLKFTLPSKYPEEVPEIEILDDEDDDTNNTNLEDDEVTELKKQLDREASENTGMAMVFTLVSYALEWLNTRWDQKIKDLEEEEEKRIRAEEEAEHQRFEGTRVTVQSFIEWKMKFDAEMAEKKKETDRDNKEKDVIGKKLTGRELFLRDKTLNESDLQFLEGDGDALPIDESLFEDFDDLEIDAEEEEDE